MMRVISFGSCMWFSEIAVGNYTDETTVPGFPIEFFPGNHGDSQVYEEVAHGEGLGLFV